MADKYCGTSDCRNWCEDFNAYTGTDAATAGSIIEEASNWFRAEVDNIGYGAPRTDNGTYDYWVRYATAQQAIYIAIDRRKSGQYEEAEGWWIGYHERARNVIERLAAGDLVYWRDRSDDERGIGPAIPRANGTVGTATVDMCYSNRELQGAWYTLDIPRTFLLEIDGTGSMTSQQTFRWKYLYGTAWEDTGLKLKWGWRNLADGVWVRWEDTGGTDYFEKGQQWTIACHPNEYSVNQGRGMRTYQMYRG